MGVPLFFAVLVTRLVEIAPWAQTSFRLPSELLLSRKASRFIHSLRSFTKPIPGTLQVGGAPFETTQWTVVLQAGDAESVETRRKALATFSEAYWPPLYTFVRRRGYPPADAQDIVQSFFVHLFEKNTLSRADQEKGRLRTFLLGSLQNFLLKQRERMRAVKRGGEHQFVSFDELLPKAEAAMLATSHLNDVNSYDVAWASSVVARAWKNVRDRLEPKANGSGWMS